MKLSSSQRSLPPAYVALPLAGKRLKLEEGSLDVPWGPAEHGRVLISLCRQLLSHLSSEESILQGRGILAFKQQVFILPLASLTPPKKEQDIGMYCRHSFSFQSENYSPRSEEGLPNKYLLRMAFKSLESSGALRANLILTSRLQAPHLALLMCQ